MSCWEEILNGGFEEFVDGKPSDWTVSSADAYPLADGTWFRSGHYGAYLGGYDSPTFPLLVHDILTQTVFIPSNALAASLTFHWYMRTEETPRAAYDRMEVRLQRDTTVYPLAMVTNQGISNTWQTVDVDLGGYAGFTWQLAFDASSDFSFPTSFFVDDVSLSICAEGGQPGPTPTPTPTNTPSSTNWTFSGDVSTSGLGPSQPVPEATVTLYRITGLDWEVMNTTATGADGQFTLDYIGSPDPAWFLILVQYPPDYIPTSAQAGPDFQVVSNQMVMGIEPLPAGNYGDHHFFSLPGGTPGPETPTPPPLPTVPWPTPTATP